jgi:hypothetical protein
MKSKIKLWDGTTISYEPYPAWLYVDRQHQSLSECCQDRLMHVGWNDSPVYVALIFWARKLRRKMYFACRDYYNLPSAAGVHGPELHIEMTGHEYGAWYNGTGHFAVYADPAEAMIRIIAGEVVKAEDATWTGTGESTLESQCESIGMPKKRGDRAKLFLDL